MTQMQQPIFILPEGALRTIGKDAQRTNIMAARAVGDTIRTTLGPKGMDKMLIDDMGDITITNDGATIVEELNVEHPSAKMMIEVAKTQDDEVGDGTTTAVVLASEFLKQAEGLLDQDIHATVIAKGYRMAATKAHEILDNMAKPVSIDDNALLAKIAMTAMTGKGAEHAKEELADLTMKAVRQVANEDNGKITVNLDDIKLEKKEGKSIGDSELINGLIIDKERVHTGMPKKVDDAKMQLEILVAQLVDEICQSRKVPPSAKQEVRRAEIQMDQRWKDATEKLNKAKKQQLILQGRLDGMYDRRTMLDRLARFEEKLMYSGAPIYKDNRHADTKAEDVGSNLDLPEED